MLVGSLTGAGYAPPGCGPPVTHTALELSLRSEGAFNESESHSAKSHPFKDDDKLRAVLKYHSHLLDFQEGLGCHIYVEKAQCESNNGHQPTREHVEATDSQGRTALALARMNKHSAAVRLLRSYTYF